MNKLLILLVLIVSFGCQSNTAKEDIAKNTKPQESVELIQPSLHELTDKPLFTPNPYTIDFNIDKVKEDEYVLSISMKLYNGAHFVSPNTTRDFSGKFTVNIEDNLNFSEVGKLIEMPRSVEEDDSHPFVNGTVNWVRTNTVYKQHIKLHAKDEFKIPGMVQFTIEPRCTLEKIPFVIRSEKGEITATLSGC